MICFALWSRASLKGVIHGLALSVQEDQLKFPSVYNRRRLVRRRPGGERGGNGEC